MNTWKLGAAALVMAAPVSSAELTVTITDVRSPKGTVIVTLMDSDAAWNHQAKPVSVQKIAARLATGTAQEVSVRFADLPAGGYAVMVLHDKNDNLKLDTNFLGIPSEGYGFSNNPRVMRKAYFSESKFEVAIAPATIVIQLR